MNLFDVVELKSGGPAMVIIAVDKHDILCMWCGGQIGWFNKKIVKVLHEEDDCSKNV